MAKKKKDIKEEEIQIQEITPEKKYPLVELVLNCTVEPTWVIYNLSRKGLLGQYEQEIQNYGKKEIEPTLTIKEFEQIIQGQK